MDYRAEVLKNCPGFNLKSTRELLSLAGLGLAGESGEVAEEASRYLHEGVVLEAWRRKMQKEMGDVRWYWEYLAAAVLWTKEDLGVVIAAQCPIHNASFKEILTYHALGLSSAGAGAADVIKKIMHHDADFVAMRPHLLGRAVAVWSHLEGLNTLLGFTMAEVEEANAEKLRARHPKGWTPESQRAKADEVAR